MDYQFTQPTQMQDNALQTGITHGQQNASAQASFAMEMRPYENARGAVAEPLPEPVAAVFPHKEETYEIARKHLEAVRHELGETPDGDKEGIHWLRSVTGGKAFSSKRGADGKLKTDMSDEDYDALIKSTNGFYDLAGWLAKREHELMLFRGICIPRIADDATDDQKKEIMGRYGDVIPSSASWNMGTPLEFSTPKDGWEGVIFEMIVPTDFPLVILSYPQEVEDMIKEGDPHSLCLSEQREVLVGASTFSHIERIEKRGDEGSQRYHVRVRLEAVDRKTVTRHISVMKALRDYGGQYDISTSFVCNFREAQQYFGIYLEEMEEGQKYEFGGQNEAVGRLGFAVQPGASYRLLKKDCFHAVFGRINE